MARRGGEKLNSFSVPSTREFTHVCTKSCNNKTAHLIDDDSELHESFHPLIEFGNDGEIMIALRTNSGYAYGEFEAILIFILIPSEPMQEPFDVDGFLLVTFVVCVRMG